MKRVIAFTIMLLILASAVFAIYLWVIKPDPSTLGSEIEGLEAIRPRNMRITDVRGDSFVVEWEVNSAVSGYVKYGDTSNSLTMIAQDIEGTALKRSHRVRVSNLSPGKKYYFWVMSDDVAFGRDGRALEALTMLD